MTDFSAARLAMTRSQIQPCGLTDARLLKAFNAIPRELFVDEKWRDVAYIDRALPARGAQRNLLSPLVLARFIQKLDVQPGDDVLDVAGGSGYAAALFDALGARVTALETNADPMRKTLAEADRQSIVVEERPLSAGLPGKLFDVILINGRIEREPVMLLDTLKDEGRLGVVMGDAEHSHGMIFLKTGKNVSAIPAFDASADLLKEFAAQDAFQF